MDTPVTRKPKRRVTKITPESVLGALESAGTVISKRDLGKILGIKGEAPRRDLKVLLHNMAKDGQITMPNRNAISLPDLEDKTSTKGKPRIIEVIVAGVTDDGELYCNTANPKLQGRYPLIISDDSTLDVGDRAQVVLTETSKGEFTAKTIKKREKSGAHALVGIYEKRENFATFSPISKEHQGLIFNLEGVPDEGLENGAVIKATPQPHNAGKRPAADFDELLGEKKSHLYSMAALNNHDIPYTFPDEALEYTESLTAGLTKEEEKEREDLRHIPIVTIDGADSRDFDDGVWAEELENGDFHAIVAIADVAHYVEEKSPLDMEAVKRGNSVYFPDMVVPMLPERLSNDLCSLRPLEDRPVMACHMTIAPNGKLKDYKFTRAIIHSHARLIYEQVQKAIDGEYDEKTEPLKAEIATLLAVYRALSKARSARGAIDLDVPERQIIMEEGTVTEICKRDRLDSHRLIEELMITANVATAMALGKIGAPCLYRVHDEPSTEKKDNLQQAMQQYGITFKPKSSSITPKDFENVIRQIKQKDEAEMLMTVVLRSQMQASYDPQNIGHFGLALSHYAHFTSPIRRYSDLVVHRSLVKHLELAGKGSYSLKNSELNKVSEHISITERQAQMAEWEVKDRLIADFYGDKVGTGFSGHITSVLKFGFFVSIENGAAEGLVPVRTLTDDYYTYDEKALTLRGERKGRIFKIGDVINLRLTESNVVTGKLTFVLEEFADSQKPRDGRTSYNKGKRNFSDKKFQKKDGSKPYKGKKRAD
jgi:ribonuclease R